MFDEMDSSFYIQILLDALKDGRKYRFIQCNLFLLLRLMGNYQINSIIPWIYQFHIIYIILITI